MSWVLGILAVVFVLDALRMRGRLSELTRLPETAEQASEDDGVWVTGAGVALDDATRRSAGAYAREQGLEVLDLVPGDLPAARALLFASQVDSRTYRTARLAAGATAGAALRVSPSVRARAGVEPREAADPVAMIELAGRLKKYACTGGGHVVAPRLRATPEDLDKRLAVVLELFAGAAPVALVAQLAVYALIGVGLALPGARVAGLVALGAFQLQPLLALAGGPIRSRDLPWQVVARYPIELWSWVCTVIGRWRPAQEVDPVESRRPVYAELLQGDRARLFEPRRETCPICGGDELAVRMRTTDLIQHKPGRFTLEQCGGCGHIFQNPRLSIEGLDFYYKDFYDGLGEKKLDFMFGLSGSGYLDRARMLRERGETARWLDVGGGHGHFCCVARDVWPQTTFHGLDLSESIDEAVRRQWVDHGYRGLFPELAASIEGNYDVVSMSHYLEHTREPAAEIAAARTALAPGGHLLIEVPDPQSLLGTLLGRYWVPWFQPQHQHLLSRGNLERLLGEHGFTAVEWHRGEAHQPVDFALAAYMFFDRIAPPADVPWSEPGSQPARAGRVLAWIVGTPVLLLARLLDVAATPVVRRVGMSNTYRVLARRD